MVSNSLEVYNAEYRLIVYSLLIVVIISFLPFVLSYVVNYQDPNHEKLSAYECGFQPFEDSRQQFNIEFYLVGILFVIFDLEIVFLIPVCCVLFSIGFFGFCVIVFFLSILTIGFVYELLNDSLDW